MPRLRKRMIWCAVIVAWLLESTTVWACGQERWSVKVGTDRDVQQVVLTPTPTTHMRQDKPGFPLITYRYAAIGMPSCWLASQP